MYVLFLAAFKLQYDYNMGSVHNFATIRATLPARLPDHVWRFVLIL